MKISSQIMMVSVMVFLSATVSRAECEATVVYEGDQANRYSTEINQRLRELGYLVVPAVDKPAKFQIAFSLETFKGGSIGSPLFGFAHGSAAFVGAACATDRGGYFSCPALWGPKNRNAAIFQRKSKALLKLVLDGSVPSCEQARAQLEACKKQIADLCQ